MSLLTIKSGCVEAVFKRGRGRTTAIARNQPVKTEQTTTPSETPLREAKQATPATKEPSQNDDTSGGVGKMK